MSNINCPACGKTYAYTAQLEYVQAASNDAALALIQSGQVDSTHNFVPNVETAYEAKDKAHFAFFLRNLGNGRRRSLRVFATNWKPQ